MLSSSKIGLARPRSASLTSSSSKGSGLCFRNVLKRETTLVITGGSGRLGSMIARLAYDYWDDLQEIKIFDQNPPDKLTVTEITGFSPPSSKPRVSYYPGNILDEDSVMGAFAKADVVIHSAAIVETGSMLSRKNMKKVNVDGTHNVVQACLECGVRALVFTGSMAQIYANNSRKPARYDESYQPSAESELIFPHYGGSKNEAENLVLVANGQEGKEGVTLRTCSLRCPGMYGEGDSFFVSLNVALARRCFGYLVPLGLFASNGITMQSLYVGNGAWAHIVAAKKLLNSGGDTDEYFGSCKSDIFKENGDNVVDVTAASRDIDVGGKFYYIGDHTPITSLPKFYNQFLRPLGFRVLSYGVPYPLMGIITFFLEFFLILLAVLRIDIHSPLNRSSLQVAKLSHSFSWDKAKKELEYQPLYSHKVSLARSMEFYRQI